MNRIRTTCLLFLSLLVPLFASHAEPNFGIAPVFPGWGPSPTPTPRPIQGAVAAGDCSHVEGWACVRGAAALTVRVFDVASGVELGAATPANLPSPSVQAICNSSDRGFYITFSLNDGLAHQLRVIAYQGTRTKQIGLLSIGICGGAPPPPPTATPTIVPLEDRVPQLLSLQVDVPQMVPPG